MENTSNKNLQKKMKIATTGFSKQNNLLKNYVGNKN